MTRDEVYRDIKDTLGTVPAWIGKIPDEYIEQEWDLLKRLQLGETHIPGKYKELIGIAVSAATRCDYCAFFHTEAAKLHGATDAEIEEAAHFAKLSSGWSTYVHGVQIDLNEFKRETREVMDYLKQNMMKKAA